MLMERFYKCIFPCKWMSPRVSMRGNLILQTILITYLTCTSVWLLVWLLLASLRLLQWACTVPIVACGGIDISKKYLHAVFYDFNCSKAGRPKKVIPKSQLENFLKLRIPIAAIAREFDVSRHHHGIDGFSRLVVFAGCSPNNRAETVHLLFRGGIPKYGRPLRIRTDHGGENIDIWHDMIAAKGEESKPVLVGKSVHNQRIERHNHALNEQLTSIFREEFYQLESEGVLNVNNDTDIFCLHFVYLPRINQALSEFVAAHNNHKVSTEKQNPSTIILVQHPIGGLLSGCCTWACQPTWCRWTYGKSSSPRCCSWNTKPTKWREFRWPAGSS